DIFQRLPGLSADVAVPDDLAIGSDRDHTGGRYDRALTRHLAVRSHRFGQGWGIDALSIHEYLLVPKNFTSKAFTTRITPSLHSRRQLPRRRVSCLGFQLDHYLIELAAELERHLVGVVLDNRRAGVLADVEGFVERETNTDGTLDVTFGHLLAVHAER